MTPVIGDNQYNGLTGWFGNPIYGYTVAIQHANGYALSGYVEADIRG